MPPLAHVPVPAAAPAFAPPHAAAVERKHGSVYDGPFPKFFNFLWSSHSQRYLSRSCFKRETSDVRAQHVQRVLQQQQCIHTHVQQQPQQLHIQQSAQLRPQMVHHHQVLENHSTNIQAHVHVQLQVDEDVNHNMEDVHMEQQHDQPQQQPIQEHVQDLDMHMDDMEGTYNETLVTSPPAELPIQPVPVPAPAESDSQAHVQESTAAAPINMNASVTPPKDHDTSCLTQLLVLHQELHTPLAYARQPVYDEHWLASRVEYTPTTPRDTGATSYALLGAWCVRALMTWQMVYNVADGATEFIIKMINCLIRCLGHGTHGGMPNSKGKTDEDWFPSSLHTLQARLNIVNIGKREDELITRFVMCPNPACGARYHMGQAIQYMLCPAKLLVRPAPNARSWVQQPCHTRLFRTVDRALRQQSESKQQVQKQPYLQQYEKDARVQVHEPERKQEQRQEEQQLEQEQEQEQQWEQEQKREQEQKQEQKQEQEQQDEQEQEMAPPTARSKRKKRPMAKDAGRRVSARLAATSASGGGGRFAALRSSSNTLPSHMVASADTFASANALPPPHRAPLPPAAFAAAAAPYTTDYVPECMYPYCGIIAPLKIMLMRKGFVEACKRHRWRGQPGGAHGSASDGDTDMLSYPLLDVYDGAVWRSFGSMLEDDSTLTLAWALNWDGFQPFSTSNKSCDAIYLVCLNLPRELRYLRQNMIVVGIRPWGSHGPNIHSLFVPLVDELLLLYNKGIYVHTHDSPLEKRYVKCLLLLVACDLPAAKQIGGFSAHNAMQGCHRCTKTFRKPDEKEEEEEDNDSEDEEEELQPGAPIRPSYLRPAAPVPLSCNSNGTAAAATANTNKRKAGRGTYFGDGLKWNVEEWKDRDVHEHMLNVCSTYATRVPFEQQQKNANENGYKWTELLRLPYFEPSRFVTIDPMHCLFLGHAKDFWFRILDYYPDSSDCKVARYIEWLLRKVSMPADYGRMMLKAQQRLSKLTAREWITWTLVLSQPIIRLINQPPSVTNQDWLRLINTWDLFVDGVRLLMSYSVTISNVNLAHTKFREYCMGVEAVWGGSFMKPNHHHLMHLRKCVLDYGPPHVFWVFAFERSNGQLAAFHSSMRTVELEMMKRFVQQQMMLNQDHSSLSTLALEYAQQLPALICQSRVHHRTMQVYPTDEPLPLILQSAYNKTWYKAHRDHYPYPKLHEPDTLLHEHEHQPHGHPHPHLHMASQVQHPDQQQPMSSWLARWRLYSASTPEPMSGRVSPPCLHCAKLCDSISLLRSEDKEAAVAFMPSTPKMWREFRHFLRQRTDGSEGQWMITGSESWPGYMVLTNSESIQLSPNVLKGLSNFYHTIYFTMSDKKYKFDPAQFQIEPSSITPNVIKFHEIHIGRDRFCGIEHPKEDQAADAYVLKANKHGKITLFAVQIQYFIRHQVRVKYRHSPREPYHQQDEWHTFAVVLHYSAAPGMDQVGQDYRHPEHVAFRMDLEHIGDRYGLDNYIPIRQLAGRFVKVPAVSYDDFMDLKRGKQESRHLLPSTGIYCSPLPARL